MRHVRGRPSRKSTVATWLSTSLVIFLRDGTNPHLCTVYTYGGCVYAHAYVACIRPFVRASTAFHDNFIYSCHLSLLRSRYLADKLSIWLREIETLYFYLYIVHFNKIEISLTVNSQKIKFQETKCVWKEIKTMFLIFYFIYETLFCTRTFLNNSLPFIRSQDHMSAIKNAIINWIKTIVAEALVSSR